MKRFLQIFTCGKWHLPPIHEPFYLVRVLSCNPLGHLEPNEFGVAAPVQRNTRLYTKLRQANYALAAPRKQLDVLMIREGIPRLDSSFFQGVNDSIFAIAAEGNDCVGV